MAFLKIDHVKQIYYEFIDGRQDRPYLVFLHEGLGCTEMWRDFPHLLCREIGCSGIVYDRIGYGKSSPLTDSMTLHFMHKYALIELPEVILQLIPEKDYYLVGHSDGATIGLISASERPARLRGLISESAHVFVEEETLNGIRGAVDAFHAGKLSELAKYHGEKTGTIFKAWSDVWLSHVFKNWNIEYLLPSIICPVLVLQGTEDQYGTVAQVESIVSKALNAQKSVVEGCGHIPHSEKTGIILKLMKQFLVQQGDVSVSCTEKNSLC